MPVIRKQTLNASLYLEVWNLTESEAFFLSQLKLNTIDEQLIHDCSLLSKRLERLACRFVLQDILRTNALPSDVNKLHYSATGTPLLEPYSISFSHCKSFAAVALSKTKPIGIDIERTGKRLERLYTHFMSEFEIAASDVTNDDELHYYWGSKEAIYKAYALGNINYTKEIKILRNEDKGFLYKDGKTYSYQLWHTKIGDNCIVVAYSEQ